MITLTSTCPTTASPITAVDAVMLVWQRSRHWPTLCRRRIDHAVQRRIRRRLVAYSINELVVNRCMGNIDISNGIEVGNSTSIFLTFRYIQVSQQSVIKISFQSSLLRSTQCFYFWNNSDNSPGWLLYIVGTWNLYNYQPRLKTVVTLKSAKCHYEWVYLLTYLPTYLLKDIKSRYWYR